MNIFQRFAKAVGRVARKVASAVSGLIQNTFHSRRHKEIGNQFASSPVRKVASDPGLLRERWIKSTKVTSKSLNFEQVASTPMRTPASSEVFDTVANSAPVTPVADSGGLVEFAFASRTPSPSMLSVVSTDSDGYAVVDLSASEVEKDENGHVVAVTTPVFERRPSTYTPTEAQLNSLQRPRSAASNMAALCAAFYRPKVAEVGGKLSARRLAATVWDASACHRRPPSQSCSSVASDFSAR